MQNAKHSWGWIDDSVVTKTLKNDLKKSQTLKR